VDRDVLGPVVVLSADVDITKQVLEVLRRLGTEPCQVR